MSEGVLRRHRHRLVRISTVPFFVLPLSCPEVCRGPERRDAAITSTYSASCGSYGRPAVVAAWRKSEAVQRQEAQEETGGRAGSEAFREGATRSNQTGYPRSAAAPGIRLAPRQVQVARREIVSRSSRPTTGQINHMLASVQGGIVASVKGARLLLVAIGPASSPRAERDRQCISRFGGRVAGERGGEARRCTAEGVGATFGFRESARPIAVYRGRATCIRVAHRRRQPPRW